MSRYEGGLLRYKMVLHVVTRATPIDGSGGRKERRSARSTRIAEASSLILSFMLIISRSFDAPCAAAITASDARNAPALESFGERSLTFPFGNGLLKSVPQGPREGAVASAPPAGLASLSHPSGLSTAPVFTNVTEVISVIENNVKRKGRGKDRGKKFQIRNLTVEAIRARYYGLSRAFENDANLNFDFSFMFGETVQKTHELLTDHENFCSSGEGIHAPAEVIFVRPEASSLSRNEPERCLLRRWALTYRVCGLLRDEWGWGQHDSNLCAIPDIRVGQADGGDALTLATVAKLEKLLIRDGGLGSCFQAILDIKSADKNGISLAEFVKSKQNWLTFYELAKGALYALLRLPAAVGGVAQETATEAP